MSDELLYEIEAGIATITLNRPERRNAFTFSMVERWADLLAEAERDPEVRSIIVTGAGNAFCSGIDLAELDAVEPTALAHKRMLTDRIHRVALIMDTMRTPVLAAVVGPAMGAGLDMALMCDIRLAGESARFAESYINRGLVPGDGGCWYLPRLIGTARALELLLTGEVIGAREAERIGLVNHVHPDEQVLDRARVMASRIASASPVAVGMIKRAVYRGLDTDLRTGLDLISSHLAVVTTTEDYAEAVAATRERRPGVFTGH